MLAPAERGAGRGLARPLARDGPTPRSWCRPLAPGLVTRGRVASTARSRLGDPSAVAAEAGTLALDGEREIERRRRGGDRPPGARARCAIDVDAVMRQPPATTPWRCPGARVRVGVIDAV